MNKTVEMKIYPKTTTSEAWARQITLFGGIAFLYWFNHNYLGDTTVGYITAFIFVLVFMGKFFLLNNHKTRIFDNREKAIEFINDHYNT